MDVDQPESDHQQNGQQQQQGRHGPPAQSSSPLKFPSSSPHVARSLLSGQPSQRGGQSSSPLRFPSSDAPNGPESALPAAQPRQLLFNPDSSPRNRRQANGTPNRNADQPSSEPLFFPGSGTPTPRASRISRGTHRGDIHPTFPTPSPSKLNRSQTTPAAAEAGHVPTDGQQPPSLSHGHLTSDGPEVDNGPVRVLWGTHVTMSEAMGLFKKFLTGFKVKYRQALDEERGVSTSFSGIGDNPEQLLYEHYMRVMRQTGQTNLNLDMTNLVAFPPTRKLERWLRSNPQEIVPMCDQVLRDCVIDLAINENCSEDEIEELEAQIFKIRPFGSAEKGRQAEARIQAGISRPDDLTQGLNMRDLGPADIDKLITIKGLIIRATPIIPDMKIAFFRCLVCHNILTVENERGKIAEPTHCPRDVCGVQGSMSLIHNRCEFADRQVIRMQETPDAVPDGQTPHTVSLCVYDELVDCCKPGDRVSVTGIFRSVPVRVNSRQRTIKALFKTYVDVLHVRRNENGKRMGVDPTTRVDIRSVGVGGDETDFAEEESEAQAAFMANEENDIDAAGAAQARKQHLAEKEAALVELSKRDDIYDLLSRSLAPSIWEMDDIKKGILLQLFGGSNKSISSGGGAGGPKYRGDINVLLVGDPGTSKSQILQYVHKLSPRGVYTSGKGSSAVGLTAYVTRDPDSKQLVLESGALVLSDGGVCCIDEFDKMSDATRSVLHEVMEQQTVSIAKAGIITQLNARTSILAAANPVGSKYNLNWPITRNIDLPPTLISRFDLLYLVLDKVDESLDRRLAKHLVGLYLEDVTETGGVETLPQETLVAYITFAKERIQPRLTEEATQLLVQHYVSMRSAGYDSRTSDRRITATTRQLESMIRLSEAHARMRFSDQVEAQDVAEANRLIREALKESATDPTTGLIDLDLLTTGQGAQQRKMRGDLRREVLNILENRDAANKGMRWTEVAAALDEQSSIPVDASELSEVIKALETDGTLRISGERDRRTLRRAGGGA